ncbi:MULTISPECIES: 3-deoxy-manno-octulosonate cytidylyltransferase [Sphingobacterium]|jgi:3-deoxy-manno-octulosonate cytidylyltransferase (CMP-KDO synthetase)|uniref:3-deoxy-manno-octulosonate cytidylyltransferase n=1 Tax=Sphingobacterium multivorum TaxID=28454 RepID=A0A2X2J1J2_SPHMU|nr:MULTISPECIES: 3-deoxy-manno-octulosonate cytidylyltransferase [Sphingobacterium]HAE67542.1 3-deoxy-manno-octulosonate cytidylyltransferase [Sphingobacterium sp.]OFV11065.1 3-deoxy-manno-octulosonate cytidylyltransferase [Sphingobacterium sp. HMSC13C05]OJZ07466.1 MAG: 3-deoxy-manno-octulosonate cytidylyltransferase [Sphingobacterium sp. 40-24]QQT45272.1 3-deoxy-manno-octulosonate cytidylyltransferase [Sphingobacterium multivorum]QQT62091.1 3-deoxy-manno-octulosonate cytidylyltransferase [Sph
MKFLGIIPARYASSRFPGKPLIDIEGKTMIQRVYEQVKKSTKLNEVVVATDDQRIAQTVRSFGGEVVMTAAHHQSGTDRCAEVITNIGGYDVAINIQGDEPFIDPAQIDLLASCFEDTTTQIATLVKEITAEEELFNVNIPKVVRNTKGEAIYFSRQTIPFLRAVEKDQWLHKQTFYKHIGIYAYQVDTLKALTQLPISMLEEAEALEQLRWLENGYAIQTAITTHETVAVDTKEDLAKILRLFFNK